MPATISSSRKIDGTTEDNVSAAGASLGAWARHFFGLHIPEREAMLRGADTPVAEEAPRSGDAQFTTKAEVKQTVAARPCPGGWVTLEHFQLKQETTFV